MNDKNGDILDDKKMKNEISNSIDELAEFLSVLSHSKRLEILSFLLEEPTEFSTLLSKTQISKTALVNYLNSLLEQGIVSRKERGLYSITDYGKDMLKTSINMYHLSEARKIRMMKQISEEYAGFYSHNDQLFTEQNEYILPLNPLYQSSWNTFISSITGVMQSLGINCDSIDIGGYSGYNFIVNVSTNGICSSGDRVLSNGIWDKIIEGIEIFGMKLNCWKESESFSIDYISPNKNLDRARRIYKQVLHVLKTYNTPIVLLGIPSTGYGIISGYQGDYYNVSTFRAKSDYSEPPIRYNELYWSGEYEFYYFNGKTKLFNKDLADIDTIKRILKMAKGVNNPNNDGVIIDNKEYTSGPDAFEVWATQLESTKIDRTVIFSNSYLGEVYRGAKRGAMIFLERLAFKYQQFSQSLYLKRAALEYAEIFNYFSEFLELFPYYHRSASDYTPENRKMGATILRNLKKKEEKAIAFLEKIIEKWEKPIKKDLPVKRDIKYSKFEVSQRPNFGNSWNTLLASIYGILQELKIECNEIELGGRASLSFLITMGKKGSISPDIIQITYTAWEDIINGVESFGIEFNRWIDYRLPTDIVDRCAKIYDSVSSILKSTNKPIILWGIPEQGYGIIVGYNENSYLVTTYQSSRKNETIEVHFDSIRNYYTIGIDSGSGTFFYFGDKKSIALSNSQIDKAAIERAIRFASGEKITEDDFISGPSAYDEWIANLQTLNKNESTNYFQVSYSGQYYADAKRISFMYLDQLFKRYEHLAQGISLHSAALEYKESEILLNQYNDLMPFSQRSFAKLNEEKCKIAIDLLHQVKIHEMNAIKFMKDSLNEWE